MENFSAVALRRLIESSTSNFVFHTVSWRLKALIQVFYFSFKRPCKIIRNEILCSTVSNSQFQLCRIQWQKVISYSAIHGASTTTKSVNFMTSSKKFIRSQPFGARFSVVYGSRGCQNSESHCEKGGGKCNNFFAERLTRWFECSCSSFIHFTRMIFAIEL